MKDDELYGATVTVDLSDFNRDQISALDSSTIQALTLDDLEPIDINLGSLSSPTFNYGSYSYPNVSSVSIAGSGTSVYQGLSSPTITLSPLTNTYYNDTTLTVNGSNSPGITVKGDAEIEGSLKVKGVDLGEMLSKMQDQLAIYQPAPELEEKWEKLRDLARQYKELVADIKEKEKIWEILQK